MYKRIYYITIKKGDSSKVSKNFTRNEFYSKSIDSPNEHPLASVLVDAAQIIRDYYGVPVHIASSFRTKISNRVAGGALKSLHLTGCAIDLNVASKSAVININKQFKERTGDLFKKLRSIGITGFGVYGESFVHIDCRRSSDDVPMTEVDEFGDFQFWDHGKKKSQKKT
ncbi:MAG TPA: hypothetical protein DCG75_03575 [Bacteroidales bacterium]|nr:hypothetical protein [Bacteroidales bacterium]